MSIGPSARIKPPVVALIHQPENKPVGKVKRLLDAVSMMNVDVDVTNARVVFEKFKDGDDDVVDVAKTRRLKLLCVMQSPGPIDSNIAALGGGRGEGNERER